jgi:hypothetical protein
MASTLETKLNFENSKGRVGVEKVAAKTKQLLETQKSIIFCDAFQY